jgi:hypothetical protein
MLQIEPQCGALNISFARQETVLFCGSINPVFTLTPLKAPQIEQFCRRVTQKAH